MDIIRTENKRAYIYSAYCLIGTGFLVWLNSFFISQLTSRLLGGSFTLLSCICLIFIYRNQLYVSKMLWGIITPLLIVSVPFFTVVDKSSILLSYGYALIGGTLFIINSFDLPDEKKSMWLCIFVSMVSVLCYDKIIRMNSLPELDYSIVTDNYLHFKTYQLFHFISLVYLMLLIKKNKTDIEQKLNNQVSILKKFTQNILHLSKNKNVYSEIISEAFKEITTFAVENIHVSRISIWECQDNGKTIECIVCYDSAKNEYTKGQIISRKIPSLFQSCFKERNNRCVRCTNK